MHTVKTTSMIKLLTGILLFIPITSLTQEPNLKQAAKLFGERKYKEAIPVLEKLVADNPDDDQAVFGLGVALIMWASQLDSDKELEQTVVQARIALLKAMSLGVEDFFLDKGLKGLPADGDSRRAVELLTTVWSLHPPLIFDNDPPKGITLPAGYRHKNSRDFEGMVGGIIWKPGGLKIKYEFAAYYQRDALERKDKTAILSMKIESFSVTLSNGKKLPATSTES